MLHNARPWVFRTALTLIVVVLLAVVVLLLVFWRHQFRDPVQAFIEAEHTWTARPFRRYRVVLEQQGGALQPQRCRQEVEIKDERIVAVAQNTCISLPITITDLFERIDQYVAGTTCGPNGCTCDGHIIVDATYDRELGYPRYLHIGLQKPLPWMRWPFERVSCTLIGFSADPDVTIVSLTPLP